MKKLTRMKLINWHRFVNSTIDFEQATLVTGENGAGKSTLLDAIQFVITCSTKNFNKAAHEGGKRELTGYIRCKTGRENKPYERTGSISAHIALEFYEEKNQKYFIVGAVIDSSSEDQATTVRYLMDNARLTDDMFIQSEIPKSISEFHASNQKIKMWCKTNAEAKKMIKARFGRIEDKFFSLIPKALAFKPIDDIKDFVYSYVLDKKEVNIDILRENVRSYQDLERTLESVKKRMDKLENIDKSHDAVVDCLEKDQMYEYFLAKAEVDIIGERIETYERTIHAEEYRLKEEEKHAEKLEKERDEKQKIETALRVELKQNRDFLALEEQEKELARRKEEEKELLEKGAELKDSIKKALDDTYKLLEVRDVDPCVKEYQSLLEGAGKQSNIPKIKEVTEQVIRYKNEMFEKIQHRITEVQLTLKQRQDALQELQQKIERLERKKLTYPDAVNRVMDAIRQEFARIGRKPEPYVLCELLEITDEQWRNAVEGYMNTQRFYILVEPENFDIALGIYDGLRKRGKAYGVGLINTAKLEQYREAPEGTLATVVTSKNIYAKRYMNMILGKVHMCESYSELKRYPVAITKEGMKYQNRVASAIKPEIFSVPFIGKNAFKVQLKQAKERREILHSEMDKLEKNIDNMRYIMEPLSTVSDIDVKYRIDVLSDLKIVDETIKKCKENIKTLKRNATMIQKQMQLQALEEIREELGKEVTAVLIAIGGIEEKIRELKEKIRAEEINKIAAQGNVTEVIANFAEEVRTWDLEYAKQTADKTYHQFSENYERRRKANETIRRNAENQMVEYMIAYKTEHDFGAPATMQGFVEFARVYDRLRTSELLEYEEKVQQAKQAAEEEFREQFLAKLQENMKQAQSEFKELNKALKDITFSNEKYEFLYMPSKRYRRYYEMIMDDFNIAQGQSIFSGVFHEMHKEVIDELFERLAINNENNAKTLDEFTDYRTYMDYDIKIVHRDESYSYYSKVCEEKSGGETQTPFYVTVAASFVQLYANNIGGEPVGLVMFDEAFNNMDDERIGGVLEFLNRLPLQILIAAPPDKIQYIAPFVQETLLVMTDEKVSYVEEYHHAGI